MSIQTVISFKRRLIVTLSTAAAILLSGFPIRAGGATTSYTYDSLNRLTTANYGNGLAINYTYDAAGNRLSQVVSSPVTTFTVTPGAGSNGTISPNPPQPINPGDGIVFTAIPANGYIVDQWFVNGSPAQTGGATYNFTNVFANSTISVSFKPVYTLVFNGAHGTIVATPDLPVYTGATQVSLTPTPASVYRFLRWIGDGSGNSSPLIVMMDGNKNISGQFVSAIPSPRMVEPLKIGGQIEYGLVGTPGFPYLIQASTDFVNWTDINTFVMPARGTMIVTDPGTGSFPSRYYRALENPVVGPSNVVEDFQRPDASSVGNGWLDSTSVVGNGWTDTNVLTGTLSIVSEKAQNSNTGGVAAIFRPFNSVGIHLEAVFTHKNGFSTLQKRHMHCMGIKSDGRIGNGYALFFSRSDQTASNSRISLYDGTTVVSFVATTFQFGNRIRAVADFRGDGSVTVTVSDPDSPSSTFTHTFAARAVAANGGNVIFVTEGCPGVLRSTIDEVRVSSVSN